MFGLAFHWYGFIIGLACAIGFYLTLFQARRLRYSTEFIEESFLLVLLSGVVGARLYHVLTEISLYQQNWTLIWRLDQGGLSIIGGLLGGLLALIGWYRYRRPSKSLWLYLDLVAFGLPVAQMVGRLANFINQELYGLPTTLPWGLYINPAHRLAGYESFERFHPLFFYEMIITGVAVIVLWWSSRQKIFMKRYFGRGWLLLGYLAYYCLARFWLEFLRLEKTLIPATSIGWNQAVLLLTGISLAGFVYQQIKKHHE